MPSKTYGEIKRYGRYWGVDTDPAVMMILKRWFPRVNPNREGVLMVSATPEISRNLEWFQMRYPMKMRAEHRAQLEAEAAEDKSLEVEAAAILAGGQLERELKWEVESPPAPGEPRDYQLVGANLALRTGHLLIADDVGLGKTLTSLLILRDAGLLPALIVCQTHLPQQWLEEIEDFLPWLTGHIAKKGTPYKLAKYHDGKAPDVLIINYAKLAGWAPKLKGVIKATIFDEGQELRREGTQKYNAAGLIADNSDCVVMTTATPIYNYGDEIFHVMEIVKKGALGERDEFTREWGRYMGNGHMGVKDPKALRQHLINQNLMIQRTRKEVGRELPEVIKVRHAIESDEDAFEKLMEGAERTADILVTREASREQLFQLSGDFEWQMRRATGIAKAAFVGEFAKQLLESGEQIVMFGWHHAVYDIWRDVLKDFNPAFYTGQESPAKKLLAKQAFLDGEARVLCMSLRAGAGLDGLQEVSHIALFGELDWSPTMHEQCIGRLRRDGMDEPVVAYFLVSENGSDPMIADVLNLKRTQSEPFMDPESKLLSVAEEKGSRAKKMAERFLAK